MDQEKPDHTVVFFDLGGSQDRLALHPEYKAQRAEMPAELERQIEPVKTVTRALGLAAIEQDGVESDDLLASCAVARAAAGDDVLIVSSDKDFAQIVNDRIRVLLPPPSAMPKLGWRMLDAAGVKEKFGVPPSLITDYLALIGDTSDNIPGLSGVGPKTAVKWIEKHGSLEGVLAASDKIDPERFRTVLTEAAERLKLNKRLVMLNTALTLPAVEQTAPDVAALLDFLRTMEMRSTHAEAEKRYAQPELF
jgi:DNA polymerase-1